MLGVDANCEYVWNSVSVCTCLLVAAGCRPTISAAALGATYLLLQGARLLAQLRPSTSRRRHGKSAGFKPWRAAATLPRFYGIIGCVRVAHALALTGCPSQATSAAQSVTQSVLAPTRPRYAVEFHRESPTFEIPTHAIPPSPVKLTNSHNGTSALSIIAPEGTWNCAASEQLVVEGLGSFVPLLEPLAQILMSKYRYEENVMLTELLIVV